MTTPRIFGFTGTQTGLTAQQLALLGRGFENKTGGELHHGDCIGADAQCHVIAVRCGLTVVIHPPLVESKRAFCTIGDPQVLPPKDYLERNHDIVDACEFLIAAPGEMGMQQRSGTWATIRYAVKKKRKHVILYPDGTVFKINL